MTNTLMSGLEPDVSVFLYVDGGGGDQTWR